jgi:peptide/nickel transport system ATP-binding protein
MSSVLEVTDLRTVFQVGAANVVAVDGVSFSVNAGENVGLVGESGCGKSTLALSIMRLLPRTGRVVNGRAAVNGQDLVSLPEAEMRRQRGNELAMIFQDPMSSLNPTMTIGQQIAWPVRHHWDYSARQARVRAEELLALVGMPDPRERLDRYPHELSGGLRQRVVIAMALACNPRLLIADEPTTALDVTIQKQILDLLDDLRERLNMAVLLITHDLGIVAERTDRVMVMYAGKLVETCATGDLFRQMQHPYSEALLGSIPRLEQDTRLPLDTIPGMPPDLASEITGCRFRPRCRYTTSVCAESEPLLLAVEPSHDVACFNRRDRAPAGAAAVVRAGEGASFAANGRADPFDAVAGRPVLLSVEHLVKDFPVGTGVVFRRNAGVVSAVADVSFVVRQGETFGLVGESGSGKSTIGRIIAQIESPTSGVVQFDGVDLAKLGPQKLRRRRRDFQLMFQDPYSSLDPRMRVGATIREPLLIQGIGNEREQWARVAELLDEVGLQAAAVRRYPHEFSGGQRQRVGLARTLSVRPRLLIADEPVSALDVSVQAQVLNLMRSLQKQHQLSLLIISHDLAVVRHLAETIGVLYLGKLVEMGPADDLYRRPAHHYTKGLIDAIPVPDPKVKGGREQAALYGEIPSALAPPAGCRFHTRCEAVQDICKTVEPPLRPFGPSHVAACHFPLLPAEPAVAAGSSPSSEAPPASPAGA